MKSSTFGNFQVGIVDDPSKEDGGGFEFASGMDIFSEPGVMKACNAMAEVTYGTGATPTDVPTDLVSMGGDGSHSSRAYVIAGAKVLESDFSGGTFNLFLTNANGSNLGLNLWNGYVVYASATKIGRAPIGNGAGKNDNYITTLDSDTEFHPMLPQGGTLKIGAGRYVASLDESFTFNAQALKLPNNYRVRCLEAAYNNLFIGTRKWQDGGAVFNSDSSVYSWNGIPLAAGSALPTNFYPMQYNGMNILYYDGNTMYAFTDTSAVVLTFNGSGFSEVRNFSNMDITGEMSRANYNSVCQYNKNLLFAAARNTGGVFEMKNGAICQSFVPSRATIDGSNLISTRFVRVHNLSLFMGYYDQSDNGYHIDKSTNTKQNGAIMRTLWHTLGTDKLKRWAGVKLNLKNMSPGCSVAVSYRTDRNGSFSATQGTVTSSNQDKPVMFPVNPRTRAIQLKFTFTCSGTNSPELFSYDPIFEPLNTLR